MHTKLSTENLTEKKPPHFYFFLHTCMYAGVKGLREASDSEIWGVFGISPNLTDFWRVLEPFALENRDLGGPK